MSVPEHCYALQAWTGLMLSKYCDRVCLAHVLMSSRTKERLQSGEMTVSGDQWPLFLYHGYNYDPEDPWNGLFRSTLLVSVGYRCFLVIHNTHVICQAYKHIFTSPSSVEKEPKATRSSNARIHGMKQVTLALIAYIVTQASCSCP